MSFTKEDLELYLRKFALTQDSIDYIREASRDLSRSVGTSPYPCVVTEFQSRKMGVTVNTESRSGELAYAVVMEYEETVVGYYEQPPSIDCLRTRINGRQYVRDYKPDYVELRKDGPRVVQVKSHSKLEKLVEISSDWCKRGDIFVDVPAVLSFIQN